MAKLTVHTHTVLKIPVFEEFQRFSVPLLNCWILIFELVSVIGSASLQHFGSSNVVARMTNPIDSRELCDYEELNLLRQAKTKLKTCCLLKGNYSVEFHVKFRRSYLWRQVGGATPLVGGRHSRLVTCDNEN